MIINDLEKEREIISSSSASTDFSMTSAILSGLTQSNTSMQTKHNCPSGNCTWDPFQSLAVCSVCNDITDRLRTVHVSYDTGCSVQKRIVYRLPNGLRLTNPLRKLPPQIWMTGFGTDNQSQSVSFGFTDTLIWSMTLIRILDSEALWSSSSVSATECGLWYCVRNYSSVVKDGNLIEHSSLVSSTKSRNSWQLTTDNDLTGYDLMDNDLIDKYHDTNGVTDTLSYGEKSAFRLTDLQLGNGFNVSQDAVYGINNFMNTTFTGSPDRAVLVEA